LWPQFREAVGSPETWTKFLPIGSRQLNRTLTRGRLIFPEEALQKCQQEQIFLEAQNFQGIPFIFLKTLSRTTKGGRLAPANIGPLLWSQFLNSLEKMEETLVEMGWLGRKAVEAEDKSKLVLGSEQSLPMMTHRRIGLDKTP
jgi:hypothetical protein